MANLILSYPNRADEATLTGGNWQTTLPVTNLQNRIQAVVARSDGTTTANTQFKVDLGKARVIDLLALCGHNFSLDSQVKITASDVSDDSVLIHDSGWFAVWPALFSTLALEWEDDNWWSGQIDEETRISYPANVLYRPEQVAARYWKIEIDDTANADGHVQIGRLFLGAAWQPLVNYDYGWSLGFESDTTVEKALGGQEYFDRRNGRRVFRCQLSWLNEQETYERAWEMQRQLGYDGEVFVMADPGKNLYENRLAFLARLRQLTPIENPYYAYHHQSFEITELL